MYCNTFHLFREFPDNTSRTWNKILQDAPIEVVMPGNLNIGVRMWADKPATAAALCWGRILTCKMFTPSLGHAACVGETWIRKSFCSFVSTYNTNYAYIHDYITALCCRGGCDSGTPKGSLCICFDCLFQWHSNSCLLVHKNLWAPPPTYEGNLKYDLFILILLILFLLYQDCMSVIWCYLLLSIYTHVRGNRQHFSTPNQSVLSRFNCVGYSVTLDSLKDPNSNPESKHYMI
jgi:hypothetical protein